MEKPNITQLLESFTGGNQSALEALLPLVYTEMRQMAGRYLRRESPDHTLQPTALVHEAYMKLVDQHSARWQNRAHFFAIAAQTMRRILVDHARARGAEKRGGDLVRVQFDDAIKTPQSSPDLIRLDQALDALAKEQPRPAQIAELRYFGGLSIEETAESLGISPATVKREWMVARAWLYRELQDVSVS